MNNSRRDQMDYFAHLCHIARLGDQGVRQQQFLAVERQGHPSGWVEAEFWDWGTARPDFRTILWNEVMFDFDRAVWSHNWTAAIRLEVVLRRRCIAYTIWPSGGKGLHISVLLDANGQRVPQLEWTDIRAAVYDRLCDEARISTDPTKVYWRDSTMGSLIRIEGGMRWVRPDLSTWDDQNQDGWVPSYKFWASRVPSERTVVSHPWLVRYPFNVRPWKIPADWIPEPGERESGDFGFTSTAVPQLVRQLIEAMNRGERVNDFARFAVGAHLLKRGYSVDDIVPLFQNTPNFNAAVTRGRLLGMSRRKGLVAPGPKSIRLRCAQFLP
ncbi:MAG: hypothetical protein KGI89_02970 [Euryarchaeota archaeon]|nr:hypothetical protein [Euryarchaeota archaeon]